MGKSSIEWTTDTWNVSRGCDKISAGCKHCYAETFAERWRGVPGHAYEQGFDFRLVPEALGLPLTWRNPKTIFVNSMSDLFHEDMPFEYIAAVFGVMAAAHWHTFQVLTKRAERAQAFFFWATHALGSNSVTGERSALKIDPIACIEMKASKYVRLPPRSAGGIKWPLPNVWIGTTTENQAAFDERIDHLLEIDAAVRFLSVEPMLGPISVKHKLKPGVRTIDWAIIGGESGNRARAFHVSAAGELIDELDDLGIPPFVKQFGRQPIGAVIPKSGLVRKKGASKGNDPQKWPERFRRREWPRGYVFEDGHVRKAS